MRRFLFSFSLARCNNKKRAHRFCLIVILKNKTRTAPNVYRCQRVVIAPFDGRGFPVSSRDLMLHPRTTWCCHASAGPRACTASKSVDLAADDVTQTRRPAASRVKVRKHTEVYTRGSLGFLSRKKTSPLPPPPHPSLLPLPLK